MAKGKNGAQVVVRVGELDNKVCSQHRDAGIGWRGEEGRAIDGTGEKKARVMLDKGWKRQLGDQCILGENEEVLVGKRGVVIWHHLRRLPRALGFVFSPLGGKHRGESAHCCPRLINSVFKWFRCPIPALSVTW